MCFLFFAATHAGMLRQQIYALALSHSHCHFTRVAVCVCVSVVLSGATSGFGVRDTSAGPNVRYVGVGFVRTRVLVRCFSFAVRRSVAALSLIYFIWSVMPVFAVGSATSYRFL